MKNETKIAATVLLLALLSLAAIILKPNLTGFLSMQQTEQGAAQQETGGKENISPEISLEIVKPTELEINAQKTETMPCPQYVSLIFEARNSGDSAVEGFTAEASSNLKVLDCINCRIKRIMPNEKITIKLRACKAVSGETAFIAFRSINSKEKRIGI